MKYHIVGGSGSGERQVMNELGYTESSFEDADILWWTGGADIHPRYYGEYPHRSYSGNESRDAFEANAFERATGDQILIGICRGAQLLNCLWGGKLWQDVDNHHGVHINFLLNKKLEDSWGKNTVVLNSYHHQMIRTLPPTFTTQVATSVAKRKTSEKLQVTNDHFDIELAWSKDRRTFLMQAHPEFGHEETKEFFKTSFQVFLEELTKP